VKGNETMMQECANPRLHMTSTRLSDKSDIKKRELQLLIT